MMYHALDIQYMRSITYHELRPGTIFSHADFHFLSPISRDKSIDSPLGFPKALVIFRTLTLIFLLYDGPESKSLSGKIL